MKLGKSALQKNIIANFFGIGVQLLNQIILVPLYLSFWNVDLYSDWIVITAISSFFGMSDIGLNSVTANQFTMSYAKGDFKECRSLLTNNYLLIFSIAIIALSGSFIYISCFNINTSLSLHVLSRLDSSYIFILLIIQIFIGMGTSVIDSIYRANSLNHKSVYLGNIGRLSETLVILFSLILGVPMTLMVTFYLLPRCIVCIYKLIDTHKIFPYRFRIKDIDYGLFKKIFIPSITFMSFPMGNAIVYQGFTLVVNKFFGAESVVLFNTTRTMCGFLRQLLGTLQAAVWPEYSIAYGKNDIVRMRTLHRKAFSIATFGALSIGLLLLIFGPSIYDFWTHGKIAFSYPLMIAFLVVFISENTWSTSSVCLMATNKHSQTGIAYILTAIISICFAAGIAHLIYSLPLVEYCLLIVHIPLSIYTIKKGLEMTEDKFPNLFLNPTHHP